jgi:hypothetical protein
MTTLASNSEDSMEPPANAGPANAGPARKSTKKSAGKNTGRRDGHPLFDGTENPSDGTENPSLCMTTLASSSIDSMEPLANADAARKSTKKSAGDDTGRLNGPALFDDTDTASDGTENPSLCMTTVASNSDHDRAHSPLNMTLSRNFVIAEGTSFQEPSHSNLSAALLRQNEKIETEWIEADEECDYFIFSDDEESSVPDTIVNFEDPETKSIVRDLRIDAMMDPNIALHLYCHILSSLGADGDKVKNRLRKQLHEEYGVDPLSVQDPMSDLMLRWVDDKTKKERRWSSYILTEYLSFQFWSTTIVVTLVSLFVRSMIKNALERDPFMANIP